MLVNEEVDCDSMLLITENGVKRDKVTKAEALEIAKAAGLDLVQMSSDPAVCKIMDYNKHRYSESKRKSKKTPSTKEFQITYSINTHDLDTKINKARKLLLKGHTVKVILNLRCAESSMDNRDRNLRTFIDALSDISEVIKTERRDRQDIATLAKK